MVHVIGELGDGLFAPTGGDTFEIDGHKLALELVVVGKVELRRLASLAVRQDGAGLARIVVAVVIKENYLATDLGLQLAGGLDLGDEKAFGQKTAWLLAKADDRLGGHLDVSSRMAESTRQSAQPMSGYQR